MAELKKEVGERLKEARERKKLKQNKVAKILGIHNSTLAKYESGEREADYETLNKLAELYEVSVDWITGSNELERLEPVFEILGNDAFEEFLNLIISHMVSKESFVEEMNRRRKDQCEKEGIPFTALTPEEIKEGFINASLSDKINLSRFFSYSVDSDNKNVTVYPLVNSSSEKPGLNQYKYVYEELGFDKEPPKEDELRVLKIALQSYRMGKEGK